jgi:hypothetical protein
MCYPDRDIDEKYPAPGIVEGDPPAQGGPDRGRHDGRDAIERKRQASLLRRKGVRQNGLRHRLQPAAARALQHAEEKKKPETGRQPAKQRTHGEDAKQAMKKRFRPNAPASQPLIGRMMAFETRYEVRTHVLWSLLAPRLPAMYGRATLAMLVSRPP